MSLLIGIDTGGTFTDVAIVDDAGGFRLLKTPSRRDPVEAILEGLSEAARERGVTLEALLADTRAFAYGSTYGLNRLIERKHLHVGALVTRGFRDTLEIRRMQRTSTYDILEPVPVPFVRRSDIAEITERLDADGAVLTPIDPEQVRAAVRALLARGVESLAICFLHAYANPAHEEAAAAAVRAEAPGLPLSVSSALVPEIREYERMSTTVFNAAVGGLVKQHLEELEAALRARGLTRAPLIMQLQGGLTGTALAAERPITTLYSGPVAGTMATRHLCATAGIRNAVAIDMGGTSFDVSLLWDGEPMMATYHEVEHYPLMLPRIEVHSIGAGGGSIAWVDESARLKVGPKSAGASPGPMCYDAGGTDVTVTDADLVLGYLNPERFLAGKLKLASARANEGLAGLARRLGWDPVQVAAGIYDIVNANMGNAIRLLTIERGYDPRELTTVAFGGAGATHAASLHQDLGTAALVVPRLASVFSAFGLLTSDIRHTYVRTWKVPLAEMDLVRAAAVVEDLAARLRRDFASEGVPADAVQLNAAVDLSYRGQTHALTVPAPSLAMTPDAIAALTRSFHERYRALYGFHEAEVPLTVVSFRVYGVAPSAPPPPLPRSARRAKRSGPREERPVYFSEEGKFVKTPIWIGEELTEGDAITGPAIVEYEGTTVVVRPGQKSTVDAWANLVIA